MSGLVGDVSKLRALEKSIRELPRVVALKVAEKSAAIITSMAEATFGAGENAYGDTWEPGYRGAKVTLRDTGALAAGVKYTAIGTKLRAVLGPRYAKYQVGRRPIFPRNGARLPSAYADAIQKNAAEIIRDEMGDAS